MVAFDEMNGVGNITRDAYLRLKDWLDKAPPDLMSLRRSQAELFFRRIGITFAVYGDEQSTERLIPFDIIPRVLTKPEWSKLEEGLVQRVNALNAFLKDIYGPRECIRAGIIPADLVENNPGFRPEMVGFRMTFMCRLPGSTLCASMPTRSTFWKIMPAPPPASPICWKIVK